MKKYLLAIAIGAFSAPTWAQHSLPPSYQEQEEKKEIFRAEAETKTDLVHTKLDLKFDYQKEHVLGEAWVTAHPHFYATNELELDAKAMLIHEVKLVNGKKMKDLKFDSDEWKLNVQLDKTYQKDENYTVYIKYTARPNEVKQEGSAAISDAKGLYFIDPRDEDPEKPTQIWTQGETESSSCWFPTIDKPNQKTSQEIYLTVPDKFVTLSNGALESQKKAGDGLRTDYWKFDQKHAPYLFFIAVGDFEIIKDKPWKGKTVDYYLEEEYAPYAKEIFGHTPEMMTFFSDLLDYQYPWNKYSQVVCRDYVSGAMENTTAVIFGDFIHAKSGGLADKNVAEPIIAHELFHHWFGDLVTTESWGNLSLNESFANYSEYLWYEYKYGKERADEHRNDDLNGYFNNDKNFDKNLIRRHYNSREDMFDAVSYNKGGYILHMLRGYLGDKAFFGGLNNYLKTYAYGKAEAAQLRIAFEEVSGKDLNWFFDQWYHSNGHPKLDVAYSYDAGNKKLNYTIAQTQEPLFEFPFVIDIVIEGKKIRKEFWVKKEKTSTFSFDVNAKPETVIANANNDLLAQITETSKTMKEFVAQYKHGKGEYETRLMAINKLKDGQSTDATALKGLIAALTDDYSGIRKAAVNALDLQNKQVTGMALSVLTDLAKKDSDNLTRAAAINALAKIKDINAVNVFESGLNAKSNAIQAASVTSLVKIAPEKAEEYAAKVANEVLESSPELIGALIPVWIQKNDSSKVGMVAEASSFYAFTKFQDPELGKKLEQGFKWAMAQDDVASTSKMAATYKQVFNQVKDRQPQALPFLKNMLKEAISAKQSIYQQKQTTSLEQQITKLAEVLKLYD